jgi:hypothetical protein
MHGQAQHGSEDQSSVRSSHPHPGPIPSSHTTPRVPLGFGGTNPEKSPNLRIWVEGTSIGTDHCPFWCANVSVCPPPMYSAFRASTLWRILSPGPGNRCPTVVCAKGEMQTGEAGQRAPLDCADCARRKRLQRLDTPFKTFSVPARKQQRTFGYTVTHS